ncbi:TonB-dependent receptor domain-containing protein [Sphingobacterium kitahiroshimense]|uniref:TonB-dependent receptor n=1 Tax=Sphingobacterium kitahiroshimense TaxID=470446 RepID=A0ABV0BTE4_9SPHI
MINKIILFILLITIKIGYSQSALTCKFYNSNNLMPIPNVTTILKINNKDLKKQSDSLGTINFATSFGENYKIKLSTNHLNYKTLDTILEVSTIQNKTLFFYLTPIENLLEEVVISKSKPLFSRKLNKTIVHIKENDLFINVPMADVLNMSPGIHVDDKSISLYGKTGTKILVDGQPVSLGGRNLQEYLTSLSSINVDRVEIVSKPSVQENASANSGIINIITKQNFDQGTLTAGISKGLKFKNSIGTNYGRKITKKLYASLDFSRNHNLSENTSDGYLYNQSNNTYINSNSKTPSDNMFHNYGTKLAFDINEKHHLRFTFGGDINSSLFNSQNTNSIGNIGAQIDSTVITNTENKTKKYSNKLYLGYTFNIDSSGQKLNFEVFYNKHSSQNNSIIRNNYKGFQSQTDETIFNDGNVNISLKTLRLDYYLDLKNIFNLTAGLKQSNTQTNNDISFKSSSIDEIEPVLDPSKSQVYSYKEGITAAYLLAERKLLDLTFNAGIRVERTDVNGFLMTTGEQNKNSYFNFFPNATIQYNINDKTQFSLSYGRYINRPTYQDLNPFIYYATPYYYTIGNKELNPEFSNNFEFSFTKSRFFLTGGVRLTNNQFVYIDETDENTNITRSTLANLGKTNNYFLSLSYPIRFAKWFNTSLEGTVFRNEIKIPNNPSDLRSLNSASFKATNSISITDKLKLTIAGNYNTPTLSGTTKMKTTYAINSAIRYNFPNKNFNLSLSARDIFNTSNSSYITQYYNVYSNSDNKWDSRIISFNIVYSFGKNILSKIKLGEKQEEESRIK